MQCLILAGGLATRLRPITKNIPKGMLPVNGKPFIEYQIKLLKKFKITEIVLCIGHKGEMIENHFKDGSELGVNIQYSREESLLGTGGAIRNAFDLLEEKFIILYGDAYLNVDYQKIIKYSEEIDSKALLTIYNNENKFDKSNVKFIDNKFVLYDKDKPDSDMKYIDYGMSILSKSIIDKYIPLNEVYDLADCYNQLSIKKELAGFEVNERFYEIGSFSGLKEFKKFIES
jgi:NDP-sugar pyrophosphorylase family protein